LSIISLARFRIKQSIAGERPRGLIRFLAPDILVGFFLAVSSQRLSADSFPLRVTIVCVGVALFTLLAETRKFFTSGGDLESFYFVQPTASSRLAIGSAVTFLAVAASASIFLPATLASPAGRAYPGQMLVWFLISVFISVSLYFLILLPVASLPPRAANRTLTLLQVAMALILLAAFQLSARLDVTVGFSGRLPAAAALFLGSFLLFTVFPFSERLISKLSDTGSESLANLLPLVERLKGFTLSRSHEEEAGFLFFLANLFRNSAFRLSTVGVAGTPVMVAVYWSMQHVRFMRFDMFPGMLTANFVAPVASLTVSGVLVYYFLYQNILTSRDYEAKWQFETSGVFDIGKFVLGVRKALLLSVHVPMTILVFSVLIIGNSFIGALATTVTFYLFGHVAVSWFSVMQKRFPFSVPFTRLGVTETVNLFFMLSFSFLVTSLLFLTYGNPKGLLMVNLFAFILVGVLEYFSTGIVNKRVKLSV
jgi:hypothetical protein